MSELKKVTILDLPFINSSKQNFFENHIIPAVKDNHKLFIVTANPEIVMHAYEDKKYYFTVTRADYIVPDGIGIIIASKIIKKPLKERIPGIELFDEMLQLANDQKKSVYFFGSKDEVVQIAVQNIQREYPNLIVSGYHHGYVDLSDEEVIDDIVQKEPDFIFVALGYPRQEEWIYNNMGKVNKGIFMGVGGSFDVKAGVAKRAPNIWLKLNLEWLYRLIMNPTRLKRMIKLPQFIIQVIRGK